jgi:hypothetical protein
MLEVPRPFPLWSKASVIGEGTGYRQPNELPVGPGGRHVEKVGQRKHGSTRGSPRRGDRAHSEGSAYKPHCGEIELRP